MKEILRLDNISKNYAGVRALKKVSMTFVQGKIHSIVGENGDHRSCFDR